MLFFYAITTAENSPIAIIMAAIASSTSNSISCINYPIRSHQDLCSGPLMIPPRVTVLRAIPYPERVHFPKTLSPLTTAGECEFFDIQSHYYPLISLARFEARQYKLPGSTRAPLMPAADERVKSEVVLNARTTLITV